MTVDLTRKSWYTPQRANQQRATLTEARAIRQHIEKSAHIVRAFLVLNGFDSQEMYRMSNPALWRVERAKFWAGQPSMFNRDDEKRNELLRRLTEQSWIDPGIFALAAENVILSGEGITSGAIVQELRSLAQSRAMAERN